jgi:hypothetical protein
VSTGSGAGPSASGSVLATVTLNAIGNMGSGSPLTLKNVNVFTSKNLEIGSCAPVQQLGAGCVNASIGGLDGDSDGWVDAGDNCPLVANASQANADGNNRDNGPLVPGNDVTWLMSDVPGDLCDSDDDNDGLTDADESSGAACGGIATGIATVDSDGDRLTDGWECVMGSHPMNGGSANYAGGTLANDADSDRLFELWERRGYNGSDATSDSDNDGCHDMVEAASVDDNKIVADPDRIAVARRALGIWPANTAQDHALDIDKNGIVGDPDRLFAARAALMPDWQPKSCP